MLYLTYPQPYGSELSVDVKRKFWSSRFLFPDLWTLTPAAGGPDSLEWRVAAPLFLGGLSFAPLSPANGGSLFFGSVLSTHYPLLTGFLFADRLGRTRTQDPRIQNHPGCWCAKLGTPPLAEPHVVRSTQGGHMADIERISAQQAHTKTKSNQALLVCAYEDEAKCRMLNLDGSISFTSLQSRAASLPKT